MIRSPVQQGRLLAFALAQLEHIGGQQVSLVVTEEVALGWHVAAATITDGLLQLREAAAVDEGARLGQIRRTHCRSALA